MLQGASHRPFGSLSAGSQDQIRDVACSEEMSHPKHNIPSLSSISKPKTRYGTHGADLALDIAARKRYTDDSPDAGEHEIIRNRYSPRGESAVSSHPPFQPFFALVDDANSSEYYHPTVHYIFSDDDVDLVTEAALRTLDADQSPRGSKDGHMRDQVEAIEDEGDGDGLKNKLHPHRTKLFSLPPPVTGVREHYIVIDVEPSHSEPCNATTPAPTGTTSATSTAGASTFPADSAQPFAQNFTITSAHSLTPSWQVLNARLCAAPTFDSFTSNAATASNDPGPVGGLMLKIEGMAGFDDGSSKPQTPHGDSLEQMMERFEKRMGELRRVIEAGGDPLPREAELA